MSQLRFQKFAWFFVVYLVFVILFGAWVRIAGAGAGCGNHWPMCNGDVIPQAAETKTIIEFTHRVTSGICGPLVLLLVFWAWRLRRRLFYAALATLVFVVVEALIGAVLVKAELVAGDASVSRAIVISLHLVNTMLLMASAITVAWWAGDRGTPMRVPATRGVLVAVMAVLLATNMTGAVTALGDTLFPKQPAMDGSLFSQVRDDITMGQHFLVRLRIVHPLVAVFAAAVVFGASFGLRRAIARQEIPAGRASMKILKSWQHAVLVQVLLGVLNILLAAPGWMQILHLLMAQVIWTLVWVAALELWPGGSTDVAADASLARGEALAS